MSESPLVGFSIAFPFGESGLENFVNHAMIVAINVSEGLPSELVSHVHLDLSKSGGNLGYQISLMDDGEAVLGDFPSPGQSLIYMPGGPGKTPEGAASEIVRDIMNAARKYFDGELLKIENTALSNTLALQKKREGWGLAN